MSSIVQHAPRFTEEEAANISKDLYGLGVSAKLLPSERDQNFHLAESEGEEYVLKIANATEQYDVLEFQNRSMMHIVDKNKRIDPIGAICPEVFDTLAGAQITTINGEDNKDHYVRLLSYLPGKPLARVKPHDSRLLGSLGSFLGRVDQFLKDFDHPAAHREFHWDLKNSGKVVEEYLHSIPEKSVIHNDGNDYNVLVTPEGDWRNKVSGIIDFGDMVYTQTVNDLAIACAYAMLDKFDPLTAAAHVVAGYHQIHPLTEQELDVLFDLICMRLCTSVCMSAHQFKLEPENEYLTISERPAWDLLNRLAERNLKMSTSRYRKDLRGIY